MIYPIYYLDGRCPSCGSNLVFLDKFGRETKMDIYPLNYYACRKCKKKFFIEWLKDENSDKMIPVTCTKADVELFEKEVSEYAIIHRRKLD